MGCFYLSLVFAGYLLIIASATLWGGSLILAKYLFAEYGLTPLIISQTRVTFSWALLFVVLFMRSRGRLRVPVRHLWHFLLLGIVGVAGTNYLLYFAGAGMDAAVADLIQFTAPVLVTFWMWARGFESLDRPKLVALGLSIAGCALALGAFGHLARPMPGIRVLGAFLSTLSYAFLIVWGKHLTRKYHVWTYLHYALLSATIFWALIVPAGEWTPILRHPSLWPILFGFSIMSVALPYACFFSGLRRVPASRAGIVSTWEPVAITIGAWAFLGESLTSWQVVGVGLVVVAIVVVEAFPRGDRG